MEKLLWEYFNRYSRIFKVLAFEGWWDKRKQKWNKRPLNSRYKEGEVSKEVVNLETRKHLLRGATAIGVIPCTGGYVCIDIDAYKMPKEQRVAIVKEVWKILDKVYVEGTPSQGVHLFFKNPENKELIAMDPNIEVNSLKPAIVFPSYFVDRGREGRYVLISRGVRYIDETIEIDEDILGRFSITVGKAKKEVNVKIRTYVPPPVKIEELNSLDFLQILEFLKQYAKILYCPGLAVAVEVWQKTGKIPVSGEMTHLLRIDRSWQTITEWTILGMLWYLGLEPKKLLEVAKNMDYPDGIIGSDPIHSLKATVLKGKVLEVLPRACPFRHLCSNGSCDMNPVWRMLYIDPRGYRARAVCRSYILRKE